MRIFSIIFLLSCYSLFCQGQNRNLTDTVQFKNKKDSSTLEINSGNHSNQSLQRADSGKTDTVKKYLKVKPPYIHQFRIGIDVSRIAFNLMYPSRQAYDIQADYLLRNEVYLVAEAGLGKGKIDYDNLKYTTNSYFFRLGVNKSFLDQLGLKDFDIGFLGARYGIGIGRRNEASFFVPSPFGGGISQTAPSQNFMVHWIEIVGGVKVEIWKGLFLGWTARGKFLINSGEFKELAPNFISGYGKGDKNTSFGFNFYISYAIRWEKADS